jgi:membrane-bound lytic murein transglycosylase B
MQFRPATFDSYAVDGNHDGRTDPWNPADAIFTAAHFLCSNGAGSALGVQRALLHYNNAQWYVDLVLAAQQKIAGANA